MNQLTGDRMIDEVIKEIATETCFDISLAKHFYMKTGDKNYCVELSRALEMGYCIEHLDFMAEAFATERAEFSHRQLLELLEMETQKEQ